MVDKDYAFIDLDGVILDSQQRIEEKKKEHEELSWDELHASLDWFKFLKESEQINNSVDIILELQARMKKIAILTKIHTLKEAEAKVYDLRNNRKIEIPILFVPPHVDKNEVYIPRNNEILIDDSMKHVKKWNESGGRGILFGQEEDLKKDKVKSLEFLLKR